MRVVSTFCAIVLLLSLTKEPFPSGSVWTPPFNISQVDNLISDSPVLLCDPGQNVHLVWFERDDAAAYIYYRTDADGFWSEAYNIFVLPLIIYIDATITPDGILHLVWVSDDRTLFYSRVPLDRAYSVREWTEPLILATNLEYGANVFAGSGTIVVDNRGYLYVVFSTLYTSEALEHTVQYIRSKDSGISWSAPSSIISLVSPVASDVFPSMAIDGKGRLHVGWTLRSYEYGVYSTLGYAQSTDNGATWADVREIASSQRTPGGSYAGVAMLGVFTFGDDEVHLTWDTPTRLHEWSADGGASWASPQIIMELGAAFGGFNKLAVDSGGQLHVVSAVGHGVFHSSWMGSYWSTPDTIDDRDFDPHGQQLLVCQGNQLHVVYHDRTAEREIWYSTSTLDSSHIPRGPIPAFQDYELAPSVPEATAISTNEQDDLEILTPMEPRFPTQVAGDESTNPLIPPLLVGIGSSVVLVIIVIAVAIKRRLYG